MTTTHPVLFGASGYTGRLVAQALAERDAGFVAVGRSAERVRRALAPVQGAVSEVRAADATDPASLRRAFADADVVITTVGPFVELGRGVLEAAIDSGAHYVDSTGELPFVRWALAERDQAAQDAGVAVVPACGHDFLPGDLLAELALDALPAPRAVHVTYLVRGRGPLPGPFSAGTRASIAASLGSPVVARAGGELVEEQPAESRRLAWFPKPVGPQHAAGFPGAEPLWLARRRPDLQVARTYLALPTVLAELAQMGAAAARWEPIARAARWIASRGHGGPDAARRDRQRWAVLAEASDAAGNVARAWVYGHDLYGFTAACLAHVATRVADAGSVGVRSPAEVVDPAACLDALASTTGCRWSVRRPAA